MTLVELIEIQDRVKAARDSLRSFQDCAVSSRGTSRSFYDEYFTATIELTQLTGIMRHLLECESKKIEIKAETENGN